MKATLSLFLLLSLYTSKIIIADISDLRELLEKPVPKHNWKTDVEEKTFHMQYGFDNMEGVQYSVICKAGAKIIPGKISNKRATYTENFEEKECTHWRFVEGRLVHEVDFANVKCRRPLGKDGEKRFYNGVVHLKTGYVVGKVDSNLNTIEFSRNGIVEIRRNNFYVIC